MAQHPTASAAASTRRLGPLRLIVNPRAGRGVVEATLPQLRQALDSRGVAHDVVVTTGPGDATTATRAALDEGIGFLAAVGGDGTVHEVVNGLFEDGRPLAPEAVFGVVSAGSGSDFARSFGLDRRVDVIARHLSTEHEMRIDVGTVDYTDLRGERARRVFANIAQVGYGAECVRRAARLPRSIGRFRYLLAAYGAMRSLHRQETEVTVDHTAAVLPVVDLVVANGQFFGGGMKVSPRALPDDGRFNVQVFTGDRSQVFLLTQKIYRGEHLPHPEVTEWQSSTVSLAPEDPLPVEADGELLGFTPASFGLIPSALRLKI